MGLFWEINRVGVAYVWILYLSILKSSVTTEYSWMTSVKIKMNRITYVESRHNQ